MSSGLPAATGGDTGDRRTWEQVLELRTKQTNPGPPRSWPENGRSTLPTGARLAAGLLCAGLAARVKTRPRGPVLAWRPTRVHSIYGVGAQGEPDLVSTNREYRCDRGDCAVLPDLTDPDSDQRIDRKQGVHQVFGQVPEPDPHLFGLIRRHCGSPGTGS